MSQLKIAIGTLWSHSVFQNNICQIITKNVLITMLKNEFASYEKLIDFPLCTIIVVYVCS